MVTTIVLKHGSETAPFYLKMDHRVAPICHHLIAPSPRKNSCPRQKHLLGVVVIILNFQDDRPENSQKQPENAHFWTLNWP